jgi:hypothetical protein
MARDGSTFRVLAERKDGYSSDATLSNPGATNRQQRNVSNCIFAIQKKVALRDNVYEYCLANCNTMALERKQIALEFSGACINPDAYIGNLYLI